MRSIYKIVVCSLLTLSITSCEKDLLEKEQYQKEIYLIGAYNRVWTTEVSYSNEEVKTYFTVSSSGTLALDRDVNVKMKINEELVDIYNKKYWTVLNEDKYYKSLDTDLYSIPSLENTVIKHAEGISTEVPVLIKTASLKIDQSYVIPVEIESTTGYPVSTSGYKMLVLLKLKNEYSGSYQMSGHTTLEGETPKTIQKPKFFDVMVTENTFGDILTDEGSVISGSMGLLPSASTGESTPVFEPIHGSWPQAKGLNIANPLAQILSAAMLFEYFNLLEEGALIRKAVDASLDANVRTPEIQVEGGAKYGTKEVGAWVVDYIKRS